LFVHDGSADGAASYIADGPAGTNTRTCAGPTAGTGRLGRVICTAPGRREGARRRPGGNDTNDTTDAEFHNGLPRKNLRDVPGNASGVTDRHSSLKNDADLQRVLLRLNVLRSWEKVAGIAGKSAKSGRQPSLGQAFGSRPSMRLCPTRGAASREGEPSAASSRLARRPALADENRA
jgi:hypothetical protein